jgi:hypothetical protein
MIQGHMVVLREVPWVGCIMDQPRKVSHGGGKAAGMEEASMGHHAGIGTSAQCQLLEKARFELSESQ